MPHLKRLFVSQSWPISVLAIGLIFNAFSSAQNQINNSPSVGSIVRLPETPSLRPTPVAQATASGTVTYRRRDANNNGSHAERPVPHLGVVIITLEEAQLQAQPADNPMVRLGQLSVQAAHQHTLESEADYFPKISSTLTNFHFNKFMGQLLTIHEPLKMSSVTTGVPLAGKDQTLVAVTAAQPVTPLLKIRQVVNLAKADERVTRAKAGMPVDTASNVEENYYQLLVAQRQLASAKANINRLQQLRTVADSGSQPDQQLSNMNALIEAGDLLATASTTVKQLTAALNQLLGWPLDTDLELMPPSPPAFQDVSLQEATDKALTSNAEVVEAEQNVVKARAATTLSKLDYVPDVAVLGGYTYQANAIPLLPRDFSFIGILGSFNVFDFGKREHTLKERKTQLQMAELAAQLTKAKVAASIKDSYFAMERSRELSDLRRQLVSAVKLRRTSTGEDDTNLAVRAKAEASMFQADLEYRQSIARLKALMGEQ